MIPAAAMTRQSGFSYVEVLIATVLIAVSLAPAMEALSGGVQGSAVYAEQAEEHHLLVGRMETVLAESFSALAAAVAGPATPTAYSDAVTLASGRQVTRNVYIAAYDGDNADADGNPFTGTDSDLLWVKVEIDKTALALETVTAR